MVSTILVPSAPAQALSSCSFARTWVPIFASISRRCWLELSMCIWTLVLPRYQLDYASAATRPGTQRLHWLPAFPRAQGTVHCISLIAAFSMFSTGIRITQSQTSICRQMAQCHMTHHRSLRGTLHSILRPRRGVRHLRGSPHFVSVFRCGIERSNKLTM